MIHLRALLERLVIALQAEELALFIDAQNPRITLERSQALETQSRERAALARRLQDLLDRDEQAIRSASERRDRQQQADTQT